MISNEERVSLTQLGVGDNGALLCNTDKRDCCDSTSGTQGHWKFPNESAVGARAAGGDLYTSSGEGVVRLHRRNNATTPIGRYCCEVLDSTSITITTCVNLFVESV